MKRLTAIVALSTAVAGVLTLVRPHPVRVGRRLAAPGAWLREVGPDAAIAEAAATLLWFAAAWLGLGLAAALLARAPGLAGAFCAAVSRRLLPRTLRRVVAGSVGVGVLLAPVSIGAGSAGASTPPVGVGALPAPIWPGAAAARDDPPDRTSAGQAVRVHPGDSMWSISARQLGPTATPADIAAEWPRWYAANRAVIGDDPDLLRPGQLLTPPDGAARVRSER